MNLSSPFIRRPVATVLLTAAIALAGAVAFKFLPVSPLPQIDFPTISVQANLPGASPEIMASSVATPLERQLGHIAGVTEMTSASYLGSTSVTLQFDLNRDIDAAARDVQAAINAARGYLPANLPNNPTYRKVNPADAPIMIVALTSDTYDQGKLYDAASTVLQQKLSQIPGVGQVVVGGSSLPAVRVDVNPTQLNAAGLGLEDVRAMLSQQNANIAKGQVADNKTTSDLATNDQLLKAADYRPLIVGYRNGAAIRLSDVATVTDSVENLRSAGLANGKPCALVIVFRQPGANIIETVDGVRAALPQLKASIPSAIDLNVMSDQTTTIRASVREVERTLMISIGLVIVVVFVFLRSPRVTLIPAVVVPVSLIGTFGVMYLCRYSLDNLSLMALTISTGFVVDDAIVVIENVTRHLEQGMRPLQAALLGAKEIGFTVLSISISLVAVFTPLLLMGGIVGRLFREFAVTLSVAIVVSLVVSLTTTPMMCSRLLRTKHEHNRLYRASERVFDWILRGYEHGMTWVLKHPAPILIVLLLTIGLNVYLLMIVPKGFFPQQDTGRLAGGIQGAQDSSFTAMKQRMARFVDIIKADPAVANVVAFTGSGGGTTTNTGRMFISLKPLEERHIGADGVIARLRRQLGTVEGASLFLQATQDLRVGGRTGNAQYQYTIQSENLDDLVKWGPMLLQQLRKLRVITDVNSDQQNSGLQESLAYDRETAARLGITAQLIDTTLYDAFGQRQVSTIYTQLNQYHVVMEVAPEFWQSPEGLKDIYLRPANSAASGPATGAVAGTAPVSSTVMTSATPNGTATNTPGGAAARTTAASSTTAMTGTPTATPTPMGTAPGTNGTIVPLSTVARYAPATAPLAVNHQGQFPAVTFSFNLAPGESLSDATKAINDAEQAAGMPATIRGSFSGTAQAFQASLASEPMLIAAALLAVYIVLGILYESFMHPITILSTLPSAGVGAVLALLITGTDLSLIALIGIILLIGIVKKNAIMMIDFALAAERTEGKSSRDAIFQACLLRFRPILMTTMAAVLGALPLALGSGTGSELRRPLGISIIGGLIVSQMLTLFTTPVVYLYLDRLRNVGVGQWVTNLRLRLSR
jgi:multidrug efflux pump